MATAGADATVAIWTAGRQQPDQIFEGHGASIVSLAVSPDGTKTRVCVLGPYGSGLVARLTVRSRCWKSIRRMSTASHSHRMEDRLVSVDYDRELRIWPSAGVVPRMPSHWHHPLTLLSSRLTAKSQRAEPTARFAF